MSDDERLAAIAAQRDARPSWPDFHPEDYCHRCGRRNLSWFVASDLWNEAWTEAEIEGGYQSVLCPQCFADLWERVTGLRITWELRPDTAVLLAQLRRAIADPNTPFTEDGGEDEATRVKMRPATPADEEKDVW